MAYRKIFKLIMKNIKKQYLNTDTFMINYESLKNIDFDKLSEKSNLFIDTF